MQGVRISVKAIVIREGRLLALRCSDANGAWYMLPGGGIDFAETLHEALERECLEETGARIRVGRLRYVRDYIARNHEFAEQDPDFHQVELWFVCEVLGDLVEPSSPDKMQLGVEWLDVNQLADYRLYPKVLQQVLVEPASEGTVYLGDVN